MVEQQRKLAILAEQYDQTISEMFSTQTVSSNAKEVKEKL